MTPADQQRGPRVRVRATDPASVERARDLAGRLGLAPGDSRAAVLELRVAADRPLGLGWVDDERRGDVTVVLRTGPTPGRHPLLRAVGADRGVRSVVDATGGLARDAARLAAGGLTVTIIESDPVLLALLDDAFAREGPGDMRLIGGDAREVLRETGRLGAVDAVYLDPMFPDRRKSALPRNDAQVLRALLGEGAADDPSDVELLHLARRVATRRVVVKRAAHAPELGDERPHHVVSGTRVRFDVYLPHRGS